MVICVVKWGKVAANVMLLGEYECRVDQKGRLAVPARLRQEFLEGIVLTRGFDTCIVAYPVHEWNNVCKDFAEVPFITQEKNRRLIRFIFSSAFKDELDAQGRILLPSPLRQYAQIKETAVIAGNNKYLEIWDKELWQAEQALMGEMAWELAERMGVR